MTYILLRKGSSRTGRPTYLRSGTKAVVSQFKGLYISGFQGTCSFIMRNSLHLKMKYITVIVAIFAVVQAQSVDDLPACSRACLEDSIKKTTSCSEIDLPCVCRSENFNIIRGDAAGCVISACGDETGSYTSLPLKANILQLTSNL